MNRYVVRTGEPRAVRAAARWGLGVVVLLLAACQDGGPLAPPAGPWNTITALGPYDLRFADEATGQVALFTCVEETNAVSPAAFRLEVGDGAISGVEAAIARNADEGFPFNPQSFEPKPAMEAMVPEAERSTREELVALANGYFETIERNDGTIRTKFHPHCNRVENGVQTTNNPDFPVPVARNPERVLFRPGVPGRVDLSSRRLKRALESTTNCRAIGIAVLLAGSMGGSLLGGRQFW